MSKTSFHGTSANYISSGRSLLPPEFSGWMDESTAWKKTCYIGDWSFLLKIRLTGPDAFRLLSYLCINSLAKFAIGQAKHAVMCDHGGRVIAEGVLMRFGEQDFSFQGGPMNYWLAYMCEAGGYDATTTIEDGFNFQVSGPAALYALEKVTGDSLRDIGFMRFRETGIGSMRFKILRQGMAGEIGFELQGRQQDLLPVYDAILETGRAFGMRQLGVRTFSINHLEACFPTYGTDYKSPAFSGQTPELEGFREYLRNVAPQSFGSHNRTRGSFVGTDLLDWCRTPVELGWGKYARFDHDFIGRAGLEAEVANPKRGIVTLVWDKRDVVDVYASLFEEEENFEYMEIPRNLQGLMWTDRVVRNGRDIGASVSRGYSYHFRKMISLCVIDVDHATPGEKVTIIWGDPGKRQKEIRAIVAPAPFKPDQRRVDIKALPATWIPPGGVD
jgi:vanillate/3-O-methylgallate O-demethylase